jgi:hypothetical protein
MFLRNVGICLQTYTATKPKDGKIIDNNSIETNKEGIVYI